MVIKMTCATKRQDSEEKLNKESKITPRFLPLSLGRRHITKDINRKQIRKFISQGYRVLYLYNV